MKADVKKNPSLELVSAEKVTSEMFTQYIATSQESLGGNGKKPKIVMMDPANGAKDVDPKTDELRVTFDQPMSLTYSWCTDGKDFPEIKEGVRPRWTDDRKTCILSVKLKPGSNYHLFLNLANYTGFCSASGIALESVEYSFSTK